MSRALRRQPLVQKPPARSPGFRPAARPVRKATSAAAVEAAKKRSLYDRAMPRFLQDILSELRKVSWPTRDEMTFPERRSPGSAASQTKGR